MGLRGKEVKRATEKEQVVTDRDRQVLEAMQARLYEVWKGLVEKAASKNATTAHRALVRLGPISEQLRAVTKDHARLVTSKAHTPPKGFSISITTGTDVEEREEMRERMLEVLERTRAAGNLPPSEEEDLATAEIRGPVN